MSDHRRPARPVRHDSRRPSLIRRSSARAYFDDFVPAIAFRQGALRKARQSWLQLDTVVEGQGIVTTGCHGQDRQVRWTSRRDEGVKTPDVRGGTGTHGGKGTGSTRLAGAVPHGVPSPCCVVLRVGTEVDRTDDLGRGEAVSSNQPTGSRASRRSSQCSEAHAHHTSSWARRLSPSGVSA